MRPRPLPLPRRWTALAIALAAVGVSGCLELWDGRGTISEVDRDVLRIATTWPRGDRADLVRAFADWLGDGGRDERISETAIAWLEIPEESLVDRVSHRAGTAVDLVLGGSTTDLAQLASEDRLEALGNAAAKPYWIVVRTSLVGPTGEGRSEQGFAAADPRIDRRTLAWYLGRLRSLGWHAGYSELLDLHGRAVVPVGWRPDSARGAVARGLAGEAVDVLPEPIEAGAAYEQGAAVVQGTKRPRAARAFLRFLRETQGAKDGPTFESALLAGRTAALESLAADLLGATLVDAQDELRAAVAAVQKAGNPDWAVTRLTEPPPWPPASIAKLLARESEAGLALAETLIGQMAPEPSLRRWISQDWLKPRRDLDLAVLSEIAAAEGGRLASEPRFRAWLKAEWTQWARQRYRWVARLAATPPPSSLASSQP